MGCSQIDTRKEDSMSRHHSVAVALCAFLSLGCAAAAAPSTPSNASRQKPRVVDCSDAYGGHAATCERIPCNARFRTFLGTWSGRFWAYVRSRSTDTHGVYRPYREAVVYAAADCLRNAETGDILIVGHQALDYPPYEGLPGKAAKNLLVTGETSDGTPFLRVTMRHHTYDYTLAYKNEAAKLAVWELHMPASKGQPQMTYTIVDGRDFAAKQPTRDVTVTLTVGPRAKPYWQGVIAYGSHTKH